eukprot:4386605-Amphidinium_carterae.1
MEQTYVGGCFVIALCFLREQRRQYCVPIPFRTQQKGTLSLGPKRVPAICVREAGFSTGCHVPDRAYSLLLLQRAQTLCAILRAHGV